MLSLNSSSWLNFIAIYSLGLRLIYLYYQSEYLHIKKVILEDLAHPTKLGKMKMGQAILELLKEGNEIMLTIIRNIDLVEKSIKRRIMTKRITLERL